MNSLTPAARESNKKSRSVPAKYPASFPKRVTETNYQRLRKLAFERECDVVDLVRKALQIYIDREQHTVRHSYFMPAGEGVNQNYWVSREMRDRLQQIHRSTGISLQAILNEAIEAYLDAEDA